MPLLMQRKQMTHAMNSTKQSSHFNLPGLPMLSLRSSMALLKRETDDPKNNRKNNKQVFLRGWLPHKAQLACNLCFPAMMIIIINKFRIRMRKPYQLPAWIKNSPYFSALAWGSNSLPIASTVQCGQCGQSP